MIRYGTATAETKPVAASALATLTDDQRIRLGQITGRILKRHRTQIESMLENGEDLIRAREILRHGEFLKWLENEFGWSQRTAYNYMNSAKRFAGRFALVANLTPSAVYELSAPSTPDSVCEKIVKRLEAGERFQPDDIKAMVDKAKSRAAAEVSPACEAAPGGEPRQPVPEDTGPAVIEETAVVLPTAAPTTDRPSPAAATPPAPAPEPSPTPAPVTKLADQIRVRRQARIVELIVTRLGADGSEVLNLLSEADMSAGGLVDALIVRLNGLHNSGRPIR